MGRRKPKKKKLGTDQLKNYLLKYFLKNPKKRMNASQLSKKLKLKVSKDAINHALSKLLSKNVLRQVSDHKFVLDKNYISKERKVKEPSKNLIGRVAMIKSGAAYIIVPNNEEDIYVPAKFLGTALNGDEVEISISKYKGRKPEGKVVSVVKRNTTQIMGKILTFRKYGIVTSSSRKNPFDVFVNPKDFNGAKKGDRVLIDITDWGSNKDQMIWGKVKKIMNDLDDHNWTMENILVENGFSSDYPDEVMEQVKKISDEISEEEISNRRDFRDVLTFTIDPDTAQDFDDAISYEELENGNLEIGVHIADVTHYMKANTPLDKEAFARSTSVYLVDRCIAMLPEKLSNNLCSLVPNKDRLVFSAVFEFNKKHKMVREWFGRSIIHSDKRFTYDEGQKSLDNKNGLFHRELTAINKVAHSLRKEKFKNGAIAFESDEIKFILDEDNRPTGVFVKQRKDVHMLIEDFMLLANKRVAKFVATKNKENPIPNVYRIHDVPDVERLVELKSLMEEYDVTLDLSSPDKIAESFNTLSEKSKTDDKYKLLMGFAIRTMAKAVYSTDNIGHYGLHFEHYTHFTSPIRRYSDVLVHRILAQNLKKEKREDKAKLEAKCVHISKQERRAMEAERDSIKYKQVEYMSDHIGEEYVGIVSGMIEKGIFVEVSETKAEGLIPFNNMSDNYVVEQGRYLARSLHSKKKLM
ncbi:MAG: ribonuclease R, partial [Saprospiraceae bacterium]|nr:ribonuclease R [Saprospiraceae bacterium]